MVIYDKEGEEVLGVMKDLLLKAYGYKAFDLIAKVNNTSLYDYKVKDRYEPKDPKAALVESKPLEEKGPEKA